MGREMAEWPGFTSQRALSPEQDSVKSLLMPCWRGSGLWSKHSQKLGGALCLPPTGQHKDSPPGGNRFLRMGICISLPIHRNTTNQSPQTPAMCTSHAIPPGSQPRGGGFTSQGQENQQAAFLSELGIGFTLYSCFRGSDQGQARHT